jgi:hypothetical protein
MHVRRGTCHALSNNELVTSMHIELVATGACSQCAIAAVLTAIAFWITAGDRAVLLEACVDLANLSTPRGGDQPTPFLWQAKFPVLRICWIHVLPIQQKRSPTHHCILPCRECATDRELSTTPTVRFTQDTFMATNAMVLAAWST